MEPAVRFSLPLQRIKTSAVSGVTAQSQRPEGVASKHILLFFPSNT
jgi:hypothetical protein